MTEDIRRDADRTDELDRRGQQVDAALIDEQAARRDTGLEHPEHRPAAQRDEREGEPVRTDGGVAPGDDAVRGDAGAADPLATDRAAPTDGDAARTDSRVDDRDTHRDPTSERAPAAGPGTTTAWSGEGLLSADDRGSYQQRWDDIQVRFIDEPRQCVREADDLVGEVTTRISDRFSSARQDLEQRWDGGKEPTTEELRQAVQRYRDFFQRLVAQ
jgi:hypothetical protein